ncbi:MAG: tRNA (guanosine(37)-N1)-methyltransferase TrmD [Oceanococcus sp.]
MRFDFVSLLPEAIAAFASAGVTGDAVRSGKAQLACWNPRDFEAKGRPDDKPYGGGAGMVLQADPLALAIEAARNAGLAQRPVVMMSPQGPRFDQSLARELNQQGGAILVSGRYEGIDQRVVDSHVDMEISMGDFVLSGGELPALMVMDAVLRLSPEVLGDAQSAEDESFVDGRLEYPQYTRPESWRGRKVPSVLMSGNHKEILHWRRVQALGRTWERRPDLLDESAFDAQTSAMLREYINEFLAGHTKDAASD